MSVLATEQLGAVGAAVLGVDRDRVLADDTLPGLCLEALEANGVLLFRDLHLDDDTQVAFCRKLGEVETFPAHPVPEIFRVTLDPDKNPVADYLLGTVEWHIDGCVDEIPTKATVLSAHAVAESGGDTEFASTYAAYDELGDDEKETYERLRVVHTLEASQSLVYRDPSAEQLAAWRRRAAKEQPLVWRHRSGRRSLVLGATASHVVGMDPDVGRDLLADLLARSTAPDRVYRHEWALGDTVIWDNRGVIHRVRPYDRSSRRDMHRTTLLGDEPIQ